MKSNNLLERLSLDWQHVAIAVAAVAGGAVCAAYPPAAQFIGPALSAVVPLALAKRSPLADQHKTPAGKILDDEFAVTVINVATEPKELRLSPDGQLHIGWKK